MPLIPIGISIRRCLVPLLPGPPSRVSSGTGLRAVAVSCIRLRTDPYPASRMAPAVFQNTSSPRNKSSHCAASASFHVCSLGCSLLPPTFTILALSLRSDLVAVAQLSFFPSCSVSSIYHIGRTFTWLLAFRALAHRLCCTASHSQSSISSYSSWSV